MSRQKAAARPQWCQTHNYFVKGTEWVSGAQDILRQVRRNESDWAMRLVREADNPFDPNAIAVYAERRRALGGDGQQGRKIGYLDRRAAAEYAPLLDEGKATWATTVYWSKADAQGVYRLMLTVFWRQRECQRESQWQAAAW
jgi:hypothetical protein